VDVAKEAADIVLLEKDLGILEQGVREGRTTFAIVLVVRTRRPFFLSRPGRHLLVATVLVVVAALVLPYTPLATVFGFAPLPLWYLAVLGAIVALYVVSAEMAKRMFYRR